MAIIVEQEKKSSNLIIFLGWVVVLMTVFVIIYYLFFQKPELIPIPRDGFERTAEISKIEIQPDAILNDLSSNNRQEYITLPGLGSAGRSNPFLPF